MSLRDDLIAAKALIDTPEKWFQGDYQSSDGKRMCSSHALKTATGVEFYTATEAYRLMADLCGENVCIFNDARSHAEVMDLFDRAIAAAEVSE